jgi:hypothetical protein
MAKQWTVMVYMAADNEGNEDFFADLEPHAIGDLDEMKSVGSNEDLDVVVQVDWKTKNPQRLHVQPGRLKELEPPPAGINTGSPEELERFVSWVRQNFRSPRNMLILWGHSLRYAFAYDHKDALSVPELRTALPGDRRSRLDLVGFDACGMSTIEAAFELRSHARYLIAYEIGMPLPGWPYTRVLQTIADTPDIEAEEFGKAVVSRFVESYSGQTAALTMLDLSPLDPKAAVISSFEQLARSLAISVGSRADQRELALSRFREAHVPTGEPLVDLRELCMNLGQADVDIAVQQRASTMLGLLSPGSGFVVDHRQTGLGTSNLGGVSAYAPHVGRVEDSWLDVYDRLELSGKTYWPDVVKFLAFAD